MMPLPALIPIAMWGLAALGVGKTAKAIYDNSDADDINTEARRIVRDAESMLETSRAHCNKCLTELGEKKCTTISEYLQKFVDVFEQIKNVELPKKFDSGQQVIENFGAESLNEMKSEISLIVSSALGLGGGALGGGMAAFGAYSGTMALATAGTGTAIGTLSGAAATNATLAWIGGGTLASGGAGVAGGMVALGAIAAGPALLLMGWYTGSKAETNLNNAKSNKELAKKFKADAHSFASITNGTAKIAIRASEILSKLRTACRRDVKDMEIVIRNSGCNWQNYSDDEKSIVFRTVKIVQLINAVIDTAILDSEGNLLGDAEQNLNKIAQQI